MNDWIKEWFKDQFNNIDLTPSSKVWDNVSETLNDWPKHWYHTNAEKLDVKPDPSVWQNLSTELDEIPIKRTTWRPSAAASILFILFASILPFYLRHEDAVLLSKVESKNTLVIEEQQLEVNNAEGNNDTTNENIISNPTISNEQSLDNLKIIKNETYQSKNIKKVNVLNDSKFNPQPSQKELDQVIANRLNKLLIEEYSLSPKLIPFENNNFLSLSLIQPINEKQKESSWKIGGFITPQTSLLNNPLSSFASTDNNSDRYGKTSIGIDIMIEKQITKKSGVRAGIRGNNIKSLNLKSQDNTTGNSIRKNFNLNYVTLDINYVHSFSLNTDKTFNLKALIGGFTGYLLDKSVRYNEEQIRYIEDGYNKWDFGTSIGLFVNQSINSRISLEAGFSSQVGMHNIFGGTEYLPANFFKTTTITNAFSIGFLYSL